MLIFIFDRKQSLINYYKSENTLFVCKIHILFIQIIT